MLAEVRNRGVGKYSLALLRRAHDAQRHHHLTFTLWAAPTGDVRRMLTHLRRLGLITHVRVEPLPVGVRRGTRQIQCTLRY